MDLFYIEQSIQRELPKTLINLLQLKNGIKERRLKFMPNETKNKEFIEKFIDFYDGFVCSISNAIRKLALVQKEYKEEYEEWKEVQKNQDAILGFLNKFNDKQKVILFEMMAKGTSLSNRSRILFELSAQEQEKLANDMDSFSKELKQRLGEL